MTSTRRFGIATAMCVSLAMLAPTAHGSHDLQFDATPNPSTAGAVANMTTFMDYGTNVPKSRNVHLATGALLAHADDSTSPVSPSPQHGDEVASVTAHSDPWTNGCGTTDTQTYTLTWVEPIGSGAPSGTVAEVKATSTFLGITVTKRIFFVYKSSGDSYNSNAHYDIVAPDMPDEITCSNSDSDQTTTAYGYAKSGGVTTNRIVGKNPSTTGTAWMYVDYTDTGNTVHTDSDSFTVT